MTYVFDTSVLIDHLRGDDRAHALIRDAAASGRELACSVLTRTEVLAGMRDPEESATWALLEIMKWVEVDERLADRAGMLANQYMRSHPGIDVVDYVIAATTELLKAQLLTLNTSHFPMIPELSPPY